MDLKIVSINVNGFRSKLKHDLIKDFATKNKIDILLLQETFVDNLTLAKSIEQHFNLNKRCIWNFGKADSCGVAIFLFNENICIEQFHTDIFGRLIRLDFSGDGYSNFRLVNAYFPSDSTDRLDFIQNMSQHLCGAKNLILGGDFNFILDPNLDKIGGNLNKGTVGSKPFKSVIEKMSLMDCFRHLYPRKRAVTWMRKNVATGNEKSNYEMIGTRLDRFYISSVLKDNLVSFGTLPCTISDHDFIMINLGGNVDAGISFGKSYWKFNDELLHDKNFTSAFEIFWKIVSRTNCVSLPWWDKMKDNFKLFSIDYSKSLNKNMYGELKSLRKQYNNLDLKQDRDLKLLDDIKARVKDIETSLWKGSIIRSKAHDLETNENPTSYFFQKEAHSAKSKTVKNINHNNHSYTSSSDILTCFKSFYETLYTEEPVDSSLNSLFLDNLPQVDISDNEYLKKKISKHEILTALKDMKPNKSPGSDGLTCSFYLKFFHLLGDTLCDVINLAFDNGELSESQKLSYITLICKDDSRSDEMKCYRPISLLNIDYKIISKVISQRLGTVLPRLIHLDQTCAVKGRSIFDNVHLLRNISDYIDQKNLSACFISLDQEKAFDRVSWSYLYDTMKAFGFDDNFVKWIRLLYTDISSSVIVNNFISESFSLERGVRQGCPLSPLLYVICLEPFANKIRNLDEIKGLKLPGSNLEAKFSAYADDSLGILTTDASIRHYFHWVKLFGRVSGSKINYDKSKGLFLGKWKTRSDHPFGISWVKSLKILGYYFGTGTDPDNIWAKTFQKFDNTLNLWRLRKLSLKGRSTVLNSLGLSKILYYASASLIPTHYATLFTRSSFRFVWKSKYEPVARDVLYLSFHSGGLNVPNFRLKCEALYLSHLQKLINNYDAKWTYFAKYWLGIQLRSLNPALGSNSFPHCYDVPQFYQVCLSTFRKILNLNSDVSFSSMKTCDFYQCLLNEKKITPKCETIFPDLNFKCIWKNMYLPSIDPQARDVYWKVIHEVIYVNYFLFNKHISKENQCPLCNSHIETINHLFLECKYVGPLNKVVLSLIRQITQIQITFSELIFRFHILPKLPKRITEICLILLTESRYVIWLNRNLTKHENKTISWYSLLSQFFARLKLRILADRQLMSFQNFIDNWCISDGDSNGVFCTIDLFTELVTFSCQLETNYYIKKT